MNAKITITGFAVCQACQMSGHDGDSCRANQLSDGRTGCINCGSYTVPFDSHKLPVYSLPPSIKSFVATMLRESEPYEPYVKLAMVQFGPDGSSSQAAAACAQGNADVILNGGRLAFSADDHGLSRLAVSFDASELQDVPQNFDFAARKELDVESQQFLRNLKLHSCPPALVAAIGKLIKMGFAVRHTDFSGASMRRILLHCGGNIAGTSVPKGIMVEATYLV
ncbi:MAG: hypothetical protein JSS86_14285 [Cyanobacteria bacterium SZAS LIN-2]|nr:hypothetical protein [Cyanobacteria bacterium SZAS LIN-2]MBS2010988.1 hypothetical protein [Cyanobacteria bacterium SZAS TMP-1]